jgi:pimeloyl-ACP methyl ester carboxylesterase
MDGTGELFAPFMARIPSQHRPMVVSYPPDQLLAYPQLLTLIEARLADESDFVLLGESFSGPLAISYAARHPEKVRALVLCVTFARYPLPSFVLSLIRFFSRARPRDSAMRFLLAGWDAPQDLIDLLQRTMRKLDPRVIPYRLAQATAVDVRDNLAKLGMPVLYLAASKDRLVRGKRRREMEAILKGMRIVKIDAPHLLLQRRPAEAWRCIAEFLDELGVSPAVPCAPPDPPSA